MQFFAKLRKVVEDDDGTLEIEGIASTETIDRDGEIIKASAIKAALPDFMDGGSGPLREMHRPIAAGKVVEATIDSKFRTIIKALVVDTGAIKKIQTGVLRGFSIGGKVLARDPQDRKIVTKIALTEISLVDRPCNSEATLTLWKADGLYDPHSVRTTDHDLRMRKSDEVGRRAEERILASLEGLAALDARLRKVEQINEASRQSAAERWRQ
jgi:hypothetical protein